MFSGGVAGMPLKPPSGAVPMRPLVAGGAVGELEQDQGEGEGDDAQIDVADPAVEHEVAEEGGTSAGTARARGTAPVVSPKLMAATA